jgi:hypothetical protein
VISEAVRAYIHNAALEASQNSDPSPSIVIDPIELEKFICDLELERSTEKEKLEAKLERAKKRISEVRKLGERSLFQAITAINQATHKEKDHHLQIVLSILVNLIQETDKPIEKGVFDDIPW